MSIYASSSDQVLLGLLWSVRNICDDVAESTLKVAYQRFQQETGMVLYGPLQTEECTIDGDLRADLDQLANDGLIRISSNPHAQITLLGACAASSLALAGPFARLEKITRELLDTPPSSDLRPAI